MKTPNTPTIEVRKKATDIDYLSLFQFSTIALVISTLAILLYENFRLQGVGIVLILLGVANVYRLYKELVSIDFSIDVSDFTMEDVMADLEGGSFEFSETQKTGEIYKMQMTEEAIF